MPPPVQALLAALTLTLGAWPAGAGTTRCWIDQGVVVVPAMVAGVAGDYILDTGTAVTQLHETRAQAEGLGAGPLSAEVRIAGLRLADRTVTIVDLDARTLHFPTPVAGVIGADILSGRVLEVSFAPCRVGLWRKGREPRRSPGASLPLTFADGRPLVAAGMADGVRAELGGVVPATGLDAALRLASDRALAVHGGRPESLLPYGTARARLRALSFAGGLWEQLPTGLTSRAQLPAGAMGELGPEVLANWRLRFDLDAGRLWLSPPPRPQRKGAPVSRSPF